MKLSELSNKIFLDRYAHKAPRSELTVGSVVITMVKQSSPQRETGTLVKHLGNQVEIRLDNGDLVTVPVDWVDKPIELDPKDMMRRVAGAAAEAESPDLQETWRDRFFWLLSDWRFVPGGRILTMAGTGQKLSAYNCYVLRPVPDSRDGIIARLGEMVEIMSRGGGVGITLSTLRPRHAYVNGVNGRSSGAVSWGGIYSHATGLVEQAGSRRGALLLLLHDWHPDIEEFIAAKRKAGVITNANVSMAISDAFMKAVKEDGVWNLEFPDTSHPDYNETWLGDLQQWKDKGLPVKVYKTLKARELWHLIVESAWASAEPGLLFIDRVNRMSNSWYYAPIVGVNPCAEEPLPGNGVCNLGAINLSRFYDAKRHDVDWGALETAVKYGVRFLDNVVDINHYFNPDHADQQLKERRVGLGTMGFAELLIMLRIRYGSDDAVQFAHRLYAFIAEVAYNTSVDLAGERGAFEAFDRERFMQSGFIQSLPSNIQTRIQNEGIRNVTLLTQAPTGSTATMVGTSTGIEPFFSFEWIRNSRLGSHTETMDVLARWKTANPNTPIPDYFITAMQLEPEDHVKMQAAIQQYVDASISKTSNMPNHYTVEQVGKLYELMYELGCKGGTVYRDGSRDEQVLIPKETAPAAKPQKMEKRPASLQGTTIAFPTVFGTAYITMNDDEFGNPFEVFITATKAGSDVQADSEALARLISLVLRTTPPDARLEQMRQLIDQLRGIGGANSVGLGLQRTRSLPDAVASALELHYFPESKQEEQPSVPKKKAKSLSLCPSCGNASLVYQDGCYRCESCGYSKC